MLFTQKTIQKKYRLADPKQVTIIRQKRPRMAENATV
jgi:hypothetical protein